ncbi:zinc finger domain-containing protein [Nocardioides okcheonensis]
MCSPACRDVAVPSPYDRERPPMVRCTWCGAEPGVACTVRSSRRRQPLTVFGRFHPSRLEAA